MPPSPLSPKTRRFPPAASFAPKAPGNAQPSGPQDIASGLLLLQQRHRPSRHVAGVGHKQIVAANMLVEQAQEVIWIDPSFMERIARDAIEIQKPRGGPSLHLFRPRGPAAAIDARRERRFAQQDQ